MSIKKQLVRLRSQTKTIPEDKEILREEGPNSSKNIENSYCNEAYETDDFDKNGNTSGMRRFNQELLDKYSIE